MKKQENTHPTTSDRMTMKPPRKPRADRPQNTAAVLPKDPHEDAFFARSGIVAITAFAGPFAAVGATTLKNSAAMTLALLMTLLPASLLRFCLREKAGLPRWIEVPLCTLSSMAMACLASVLLPRLFPLALDSLGLYLFLFASYSVVAAVFSEKKVRTAQGAAGWAMQFVLLFALVTGVVGFVRELLAYGQVWGISLLPSGFTLEGAKMPFFGLILLGLLIGLLRYFRSLYAVLHRRRAR
ncbi:Rnf-Nqr domain containing protein [Angelakisella massiliensis]|uniref:Rnf-Nqr domain containing protein n=1 Tax=Angelakisella massiliensis TaxID=1871018 RepID=UPI0011132FEF|nr:Rnf-Nqr domain containing protein [Angelakisella massiliensis]